MDLFALVARLTLDSSEYEKKLKSAEDGASGLSSKWAAFGKVAKGVGIATAAAVGAAATAVGVLTKSSVQSYAEYEQLAGGVKKLYDTAADEVMKYANEAYKTSGMSANQYMKQATSFSAALVNSLDGDFSAAAKQTDVAMRAISDNFNTFGGDISNVQNAFQGFAKQNYTMLDNLKLGYGGTKTEMERLIADANEYAKANGMAANLSIDSFSDVVTAIDLIQQKQGIAGTTAKEAATTIEGSLNMTKAAWENLLTGLANPDADMGQLIDNLVVAIVGDKEGRGLLNQLVPAVQRAIEGIGKFVQTAVPALTSKLPSLIQTFVPVLIQSAVTLVTSLVQALPGIVSTLVEMMPDIVKMVIDGLVNAVSAVIPLVIKQGPKIVKALASGILKSLGVVLSAGKKLIQSLVTVIANALSSFGSKVISYAKKIPNGIKKGLGSLASIGRNLIEGLWSGIKGKFDSVVSKVKALASKLPTAVKKVLGIASPSKVFMEIGKWIPEGLALGIERNIGAVQSATDAMSGATEFTPFGGSVNASGGFGQGTQIINYITVDGAENPEDFAERFVRKMKLDMRTT